MNVALQRLRELRARNHGLGSNATAFIPEYMSDSIPEYQPSLPAIFDESERGYLVPSKLPAYWREWYEERAAIREYDGGQAREHAEAEALQETIAAMRIAGERGDGAP